MAAYIPNKNKGAHARRARLQPGQALVELALSITLIFLLLAATIDLGLAFKTYQTLVNATAEASNYLVVNPVVNCAVTSCPNNDPVAGANMIARRRFQTEQGDEISGSSSTLDLNADGEVDSDALLVEWVQIDPADNTQVTMNGDAFAVDDTYDPADADPACRLRQAKPTSTNPNVTSCFIVIRSQMLYRPFVLQPILGEAMTIREISVYEVVKNYTP